MSAISFRFQWSEDEAVIGSGFRFGNCLLCVAPDEQRLLGVPSLVVVDHPQRILQVHTRLLPYDRENTDGPQVLAMMLEDDEEQLFPDLSLRFILSVPVGSRVRVQRNDMFEVGEIIDRERSVGNFRYFVVLRNGKAFEGAPVFLDEDQQLIGIVTNSGPGYVTVLGLEPATNQQTSRLFSRQENVHASISEAYRSLLPDRLAREDRRDRVSRMNLFLSDGDYQMT